jgi:hypothetical protein
MTAVPGEALKGVAVDLKSIRGRSTPDAFEKDLSSG